jgi:rod shape-determining protein MreC
MVRFIQHGLDVKVGDVFLSSAIGSKFPSGYPVGRVTHVEKQSQKGAMSKTISGKGSALIISANSVILIRKI